MKIINNNSSNFFLLMRQFAQACLLLCLFFALNIAHAAEVCSAPIPAVSMTGTVNGYWSGVSASGSTITLASAVTAPRLGASTPIVAGDLLIVMQMQGANFNTNNTSAYGDGSTGRGFLNDANYIAGKWEYVTVLSVSGSTVTTTAALTNVYTNANVSGTNSVKRFQVIRVAVGQNITLSGTVTPPAWDGFAGGVVALEAIDTINLAGFTINADEAGFRGGGTYNNNVDDGSSSEAGYRGTAGNASPTAYQAGASKGEGISGAPRWVRNTNNTSTDLGTTNEYPNGSILRGAPGTAGGGGNQHNCGGGGGGNGGQGGNASTTCWRGTSGGLGGAVLIGSSRTRLSFGGAGGAGDNNNAVLGSGVTPHGGDGGGIIIVRANATTGTGTLSVNGQAGNRSNPTNDAGGGGGAGGSILYLVATGSITGVTFNARGGDGGNSDSGHGPAGGGGGGVVLYANTLTGSPTIVTTGGAGGTNGVAVQAASGGAAFSGTTSITPVNCPAYKISGVVFQDTAGNLLASEAINDANNPGINGVTVRLFSSAGVQLATTTTSTLSSVAGSYSFTVVPSSTYYVVVDAPTTTATGTTGVLAEQTYAAAGTGNTGTAGGATGYGGLCVGAAPTYTQQSATTTANTANAAGISACFGGQDGTLADSGTTTLNSKEHVTRVVVGTADVTATNFGFSFNVVTNLNDSAQGSLRQFIVNANAISGANAMRFVPALPTNQSNGGNTWWRIAPTSTLPAISGANGASTTLDGRAYNLSDGTTQLQTNTASVGTAQSVGTGADARTGTGDELSITTLNAPELEINRASTTNPEATISTTATTTIIQNLCINNPSAQANVAIILVSSTANSSTITNNVLGSSCGSATLDGTGSPTNASSSGVIGFENSTGVTISNNKVGNKALGIAQLTTAGAASNVTISGNEVFNDTGAGASINLGVGTSNTGLSGTSSISGNYLWGAAGLSFEDDANSIYSFSNNTVTRGAKIGATISTSQLRTITNNVFQDNAGGAGVVVFNTTTGVQISQNSFLNNTGNAIDLGANNVTTATSCTGAGVPNGGLGRPVITSASLAGTNLTVAGSLCDNASTYTVEFYKATASCPTSTTGDCGSDSLAAGEGSTYLGRLTGQTTASFSGTFSVTGSGLVVGDNITAILIRTTAGGVGTLGDTSEFSANFNLLGLSGVVYDDVNYGGGAGRDLATATGVGVNGVRVELYKETSSGSGSFTFLSSTSTSTLNSQAGSYQFNGLTSANYRVRVVNNPTNRVASTRSGDSTSLYGIQTYRTDVSTGSVVAVTNEVGGRTPSFVVDAASVNTVGNAFPNGGASGSQSLYWSAVTLGVLTINNVDFGFNFDTIVNTSDCAAPSASVQCLGSVRQFITNANALDNTGLAQAGLTAAKETSIFQIAGVGPHTMTATSALPTVTGVDTWLDASTQSGTVCDPTTARVLKIALRGGAFDGLTTNASGTLIKGFSIGSFQNGVVANSSATGTQVLCNFVGLGTDGTTVAANSAAGILLASASNSSIGDATATGRNVIGGNTGSGVSLTGTASNNTIQGNYIGLNNAGTSAKGNNNFGISATGQTNLTLGGSSAAAGNVIAASGDAGIYIAGTASNGVTIRNNLMGTFANGTTSAAVGNGIKVGSTNTANINVNASTTVSILNNTLGYSVGSGIYLGAGVNTVTVQDNLVGTPTGGSSSIGLQLNGANGATIQNNVFVRATGVGVFVNTGNSNVTLTQNKIGILADGVTSAPNASHGVSIVDGSTSVIVGSAYNTGSISNANIIAYNGADGISMTGTASNSAVLRLNTFFSNVGLAVDLDNNDVTLNDANDSDTGVNGRLNFPIILTATVVSGGNILIEGCSPAGSQVDIYKADSAVSNIFAPRTLAYGEGATYLASFIEGSGSDTDSGACSSPANDLDGNNQTGMNKFSVTFTPASATAVNDKITGIATTSGNLSSEFGAVVSVLNNDYGDAPLTYGQVSHVATGPILGSLRDIDTRYPATPGILANLDDTTGVDDEDGVSSLAVVHAGMIGVANGYVLPITVSNITASTNLCAWLDFNRNGTFDSTEGACRSLTAGTTSTSLSFTVPSTLTLGDLYARVRISTAALTSTDGGNTSAFANGEVEDYYLANGIKPAIRLSKVLSPISSADTFSLQVTGGNALAGSGATNPVTNIGNGGTTGWVIVDAAASLTLTENRWVSQLLTAYTTSMSCTQGDASTVVVSTALNLTDANSRTASVTAPSNGAAGVATQLLCTYTNTIPTLYSISGKVFKDTGAPIPLGTGVNTGIANDALQNGSESVLPSVTLKLTNCAATTYATTSTNGTGQYSFDASLATAGTVCVEEVNLTSYLSTGANANTTVLPDTTATVVGGVSYTYTRSTDRIQWTLVANTDYTDLNFADIPMSQLNTNGSKTVNSGSSADYAHTFVAGSTGSVTFTSSAIASPSISGWNQTLFIDSNCNSLLEFGAGDTALSGAINVVEGQTICILAHQDSPSGAPTGALNVITLLATINYTGASPSLSGLHTRTDNTLIADSNLILTKQVRNLTTGGAWSTNNQAKSGQVLEYRISYSNLGALPISNLVINDATTAYTLFVSAACDAPLPSSLTGCIVTTQPALNTTGAIIWTFTGTLNPSSLIGTVSYQVRVE